jgi:CRISPR-associated protein Cas2
MAIHAPQLFLLAYDIANPKRLVKVHRQVSKRGLALQYSVFLLLDTPAGLDRLLGQLDRIIDGREDDIRVYPLPANLDAEHFGRQFLPEGVRLLGDEERDRLGALTARDTTPAKPAPSRASR